MCSGRVDLAFVLRAFSNGMDGVFIGGCRLNECNYITHGNYDALGMVLLCKKIMEHLRLNPERLRIEFMSSGEGILFTEVVDDFVNQVRGLGPLGSGEGIDEDDRAAGKLRQVDVDTCRGWQSHLRKRHTGRQMGGGTIVLWRRPRPGFTHVPSPHPFSRMSRAFWRFQSRLAASSRLSCSFLPSASASFTLARPLALK